MPRTLLKLVVLCLLVALLVPAVFAQEPAEIQNDEGGVQIIEGQYAYSDPGLPDDSSEPIVFMGDVSNLFVEGGFDFSTEYLDINSTQIIAQTLNDIKDGPLQYRLLLPIDPNGKLHDVDNDAEEDSGVMVFSINFTFNSVGTPFIDERELIYYSSLTSSQDFETLYQINGGKMILFTREPDQGFPSGFGEDGKLFTEDDPIATLPQGYTVVDLNTDPFTFSRAHTETVDVVESEGTEFVDFSEMSYTEAFDAMIEMMRNEYSFTELKGVDWDALIAEYRPRIEEAEQNADSQAYNMALAEFGWEIPDGHIYMGALDNVFDYFIEQTDGGLGMSIRELDDDRVITTFILPEGPAALAGIEERAEILEINGTPIGEFVSANVPLSGPFSNPESLRLQQLRYAIRFPVDTEVTVTYQNPGDTEPQTTTLTTIAERASLSFSSINRGLTGNELPVEFKILDSGYGYVRIYSFSDDRLLSIMLWQRAMKTFQENGVPGIVIDLRNNGGGSPDTGNVMLGYFFDEPTYAGTSAFYYPDIDRFELNPLYDTTILPAAEADRYHGDVAVLVGPACASMCEFFAYAMTLLDNTAIIGQYPSSGLGGGIEPFAMPEAPYNQFTIGRGVGADNEIHIEGTGVVPDVRVPVTEETLFSEGDPILETAVAWLDEAGAAEVIEGGAITIGESITGEITEGQRVRYTLDIKPGDQFSIYLEDADQALDTYLWLYAGGSEEPVIENDDFEGIAPNSAIEGLTGDVEETIIIEVGTYDDGSAGTYTLRIVDLNAATEAIGTAEPEAGAAATAEPVATEEAVPAATEEAGAAPTAEPMATTEVTPEMTPEATAEATPGG